MERKKIGKFTEVFRPKKLDDVVLPKRIYDIFKNGEIEQSYLFYSGVPGSGKTSLAKVLAKDYDSLYINVSDESSVETVRDKIKSFGINSSMLGGKYNKKVIILDEIDGASDQFEKALRGVMEDPIISKNVNFLATCNYLSKVSEPVQSRFECIEFEPMNASEVEEVIKGIKRRLKVIIVKYLGMKIENDVLDILVRKSFPDMRSMYTTLQKLYSMGIEEIQSEDIKQSFSYSDIYTLCLDKPIPQNTFKFIFENYDNKADEVINSLGINFTKWVMENKPEKIMKLAEVIDVVNNASYKRKFVIDPMVNVLDCIFKIQKIFNG
jgi:DNA polymerase III delta prime subunit